MSNTLVVNRKKLLLDLESELGVRLVTFVTGDRQGRETRIAGDSLPLLASLLAKLENNQEQIALFLYTPGGETITGWGIVNLIRQYCDTFSVIVPFRALSTGTLIALGADKLYLGRHGFLSPVDPSVTSPYNPPLPGPEGQSRRQLPVSVEDLTGFIDLARRELNISDQEYLTEVLKILSDKVHPLALGAVYRAREQSGSLARRLLEFHMDDRGRIDAIVEKLTKELPTHNYLIGHEEARDFIGLDLEPLKTSLEGKIWALYTEYENWFHLTQPHSPVSDLGQESSKAMTYERAAMEMLHGDKLFSHVFVSDSILIRSGDQVGEQVRYQGWRSLVDGEDPQ